jgi:RNA polymerase sigma-70 factor (ECF subfamily)
MAQDLTQGFFTQLLEKQYIKSARSERGRFRSFLLASVKNYLANEWDREQAQKRGGGTVLLSFDFEGAKASLPEPGHEITPEVVFERQWALTVLENVLAALRQEMVRSGNEERFQRLKGFLTGEQAGIKLRTVATELEMSEGAVKVAIHRMRRRFGEMLQSEIASTLNDPREVDEEIRYLFAVITS